MLFNSFEFPIFFALVFLFYWVVLAKSYKQQNILLLLSSYVFYGWWDSRFLALIFISSVVDYIVGQRIYLAEGRSRRNYLYVSILVNLGILFTFKYFNFFLDSFIDVFGVMGMELSVTTWKIILPVGISFYTFQTMSYTIDIYRNKMKPSYDPIAFFAYVSFFPQLVAGPIERAIVLLPQFEKKRILDGDQVKKGLRQILWGFFKKLVIADNCAIFVDAVFADSGAYNGSTLALALVMFGFQIYCDFSGYTDIALGLARLLGFELMKNFNFPYFARDIGEFWRRWHISLSTWFRDYLYIPLGGSRGGKLMQSRNVLIIFLVSGLWHGANWTYVLWGFVHALCFLALVLTNRNRNHLDTVAEGRWFPNTKEFLLIGWTFSVNTFSWVFFRADSLSSSVSYMKSMFSWSLFEIPFRNYSWLLICAIVIMFVFEWIHRTNEHGLDWHLKFPKVFRWATYYSLLGLIFFYGGSSKEFIYFQF